MLEGYIATVSLSVPSRLLHVHCITGLDELFLKRDRVGRGTRKREYEQSLLEQWGRKITMFHCIHV